MLLRLLRRWRDKAIKAGRTIARIVVAFEAGPDGFWLACWLRAHRIKGNVIHPTSIAIAREHPQARTAAALSAGAATCNFYNHGLVPAARLDRVRTALQLAETPR